MKKYILMVLLIVNNASMVADGECQLAGLCALCVFKLLPDRLKIPIALSAGTTFSVLTLTKGWWDLQRIKQDHKNSTRVQLLEIEKQAIKEQARLLIFLGTIVMPMNILLGCVLVEDCQK